MAMSEDLLKVELSPADGQFYGTFTEARPLAEVIGQTVAFHIDGTSGGRRRYYGVVAAASDLLENIDNKKDSDKQVVRTRIYLIDGPIVDIEWSQTAVAVAEVAAQQEE